MGTPKKRYKYLGYTYFKEPGTVANPGHRIVDSKGHLITVSWHEGFEPTREHFIWFINQYTKAMRQLTKLDSQMRSKHGPE